MQTGLLIDADAGTDADTQVQQRFAAGDETALRAVYDRWAPLVLAYSRRRLANETDAEDVTQQVFVAAWSARDRFDPTRGTLPGWLLGLTRHKVADRVRSLGRTPVPAELRLESAGADTTDEIADRLLLAAAMRQLPAAQRRVLSLAFWWGCTHAEIAERLDLPLGTVKSQLRRGLDNLRRQLHAEEVENSAPRPPGHPGASGDR